MVVPDKSRDELRGMKLPEGSEVPPDTVTIESVGHKAPFWLEEGMLIAFSQHAGCHFTADGKNYFLLDPAEVLCTFRGG